MPTQSSSQPSTYAAFAPQEWSLLVRLPGQVVIAATSAEADSPKRTVAEGLAGLDAIAAGLSSDNQLVRRVVSTIYAERSGDEATAEEFADRAGGLSMVLMSCHRAAELLAARAYPEDRSAYQQWIEVIASSVCRASRTGGVFGVGGVRVSAAEQMFLNDLAKAFGG
jgi:hypothetical protein